MAKRLAIKIGKKETRDSGAYITAMKVWVKRGRKRLHRVSREKRR